jgi:hypothetical protein
VTANHRRQSDQEPLALKILREYFAEQGREGTAEELLEKLQAGVWTFLNKDERIFLTRMTLIRVAAENPHSLRLLLWLYDQEEGQDSWAACAREMDVHRSTVTRQWLPKALALFVGRFLEVLKEYLCENGYEQEWQRIGMYFGESDG